MSSTQRILRDRIAVLQRRMDRWGVSALLITNDVDIRYLTGFVGHDSWALVMAGSPKMHVLSDSRFEEQIQREAPQVKAHMRKRSLAEAMGELARPLRLRSVALQQDYVTLGQRKNLGKHVKRVGLKPVDDGLIKQRAVKDAAEVELIRKAGRVQIAAFKKTVASIRPGQTESEIAARLEYEMRVLGADGPSFDSIVAADANSSLPHAIPGKAKIKRNGFLLIDWGAKFGGYCSDMTRVFAIDGAMPAKVREIYKVVLEAQEAAIDAIGPGKSAKSIDDIARGIIKKAGHGKKFGHGLGHGLGLDIHEQPVLSFRVDEELKPGHVVTVEPGIYLPGVGGVRLEDDVLVTAKGREILTDLPKDLRWAMMG